MFCPRCGRSAVEGALYCHSCGARLPNARREEFTMSTDDLGEKVKQLIHEGNVTRITIKGEKGETLLDLPLTVGIVGILLAPVLAAVGAVAALATRCTVIVERRET